MQPRIGAGFGTFSRVLGPWTDFFPSSAGLGLDTSQFGVGVGTKISGGPRGATIRKLIVDPPFNIAGNNAANNWRLLVLATDLDPGKLVQLSNEFQQATNGWPRKGGSDLSVKPLFDKIISNKTTVNNYSGNPIEQTEWTFDDDGPSVGPGEMMTVILVPLFNETGVPGYGAANSTYVSMTVLGRYEQILTVSPQPDSKGRSIPPGMIGGI